MLIILLLIFIGLIVLGIITYAKTNWENVPIVLGVIGTICCLICAIFIFIAINQTIKIPQMNERITIYQEENARIEEQIKTTIQVYQDYEQGIFDKVDLDKITSEKLLLLTSLYPELKSDTMVQELIQVYIDNNNQLKELKNSKLDYELWRWWLCFC